MPDGYTPTLYIQGFGVGEVTLAMSQTTGFNCPGLYFVWKNRTPFNLLGCTKFRIYPEPQIDSYNGFYPICEFTLTAQIDECGRADGDVTNSGTTPWTASSGSDLYKMIDDTDATFTEGSATGVNVFRFSISDRPDPVIHTGHTYTIRAKKSAAGGDRMQLSVNIYDTTIGVSPVVGSSHEIGDNWQDYIVTLTELEASSISDYTSLEAAIVATTIEDLGSPRNVRVSNFCLTVPSLGGP